MFKHDNKTANQRCEFCEIARSERKVHMIYEDELVMAYVEPEISNVSGIVVAPRVHYCNLDELGQATADAMISTMQRATRAIRAVFAPEGTGIVSNSGTFKQQVHFHVHIFPRFSNDWLRGFASDIPSPVWSNLDGIAEELKKSFDAD